MSQSLFKTNGTAAAKACFFTAVLNSVFAPGYAQEAPSVYQPPVDLAERALQWGPFDIRPSLRGAVVYDDNIFIQPDDKESDLIWSLSPGVLVGAGDYLGREANQHTLQYAPTFILFTENSDENAVDHDARLRAEFHENRWVLGVEQTFQYLSGAVIDVGDRIDRRLYNTFANFAYEISPKTSFDLQARQSINDYEQVNDFNEWSFGGGVDYAVTPKVKVGVGTVFGWVDVRNSANQSYQQGLLRGSYTLTEKLEARGSIGGEYRQFEGDQSSRGNLVFSAGGIYRPLVNTSVNFDIYRRNQNSVTLTDHNYTTTGFAVGVRQLFREKYTAHASGGYENADYEETGSGVNADRNDNYFLFRAGVDWNVVEKFVLGVFYQYRDNSSSTDNFDFQNHQVGVPGAYQF